ncbi:hypothetical protein YC2023_065312 [Brassica napus]
MTSLYSALHLNPCNCWWLNFSNARKICLLILQLLRDISVTYPDPLYLEHPINQEQSTRNEDKLRRCKHETTPPRGLREFYSLTRSHHIIMFPRDLHHHIHTSTPNHAVST